VVTSPADLTPLLLLLAVGAVVLARARHRPTWPVRLALAVGAGIWIGLAGGAMWMVSQATAAQLPAPPVATSPGNPCTAGAPVKSFTVSLINLPIFLNRFGDVVPEGRMYILDSNIATVRQNFKDAANPAKANVNDLIEPLTLRANQGDCIEISFTNRLNEAAPQLNRAVRDSAIFTMPGEIRKAAGASTLGPRELAPALSEPKIDFDPANAPNASMHFDGLDFDVKGSDGTVVGNNPDSTAKPGQSITYRLSAPEEGEFQFKDGADFSSVQTQPVGADGKVRFIGSHSFGAFGAVVVEPRDATWVDSRTGGPLASGTRAVIKRPNAKDFRENVLFMHDEVEAAPGILTRFCRDGSDDNSGTECIQPTAAQLATLTKGTLPGLGGGDADAIIQYGEQIPTKLEWFAFNYRSEPGFNREELGCPAATRSAQGFNANRCVGEETSLSSWVYGDPGGGDLVFANYRGEPTQVRLMHAAEMETHTFHWHVNRWVLDPKDEGGVDNVSLPTHRTQKTNILDVQAVSPGTSYDLVVQGGAGSSHRDKKATFGDIIFHCHLYPHFATGMWGLNRTLDKREDGTRTNPDGTPIPALAPLTDFDYQTGTGGAADPPPSPTATTPGFPLFIPGKVGFKAPKTPLSVSERTASGAFPPTQKENDAADPGAKVAGGFFQDPCPAGRPTKNFNVAAIQIAQTYNEKLKWKNPQSRVYVLESDRAAVEGGKKPEPFSPLLNVGDCVTYNLTNRLPELFGGNVFDRRQETNEVGIHQHMVQFDVLSSDGAANGWNYDQGADPGQTFTYRNFVHENTATNSFHDHFFANVHQDNGLFGGATIHDPGCRFTDRFTGDPVTIGTIVDVKCSAATDYAGFPTSGTSYRNASLFIEDHVPMFQPDNPNSSSDDAFVQPDGVPIFPAKFPSSPDDQGVVGVNYNLEPYEARRNADPSLLFSSRQHGPPGTPEILAYEKDRIRFKLFQLSQEESHGFNLDRFSWADEPKDTGESNIVQAQHQGMLEYFEVSASSGLEFNNTVPNEPRRSYRYYYGGADDQFLGAWGLITVTGCQNPLPPNPDPDLPIRRLQVLSRVPDTCTQDTTGPVDPVASKAAADLPPRVPCPTTAPIRTFDITAINKDITYNNAGDHDPNGLMYVLTKDVAAVRNGTKAAEPLVIRALAGDCVDVTLRNALDPAKMTPQCHESPEVGQLGFKEGVLSYPACVDRPPRNEANVPGFEPFPVSNRVGLRAQRVGYNTEFNDNTGWPVVTFNNTAAPGGTKTYRWYADGGPGMAMLTDIADPQHHVHHGLFGALVIEPAGSGWVNPATGQALDSGTSAVITHPTEPDFRENIVLLTSDLALFKSNGQPVPDNLDLVRTPSSEADDPEDQGDIAVNYRNQPWSLRFANDQNLTNVFSSVVHGDPATPLFKAYAGDKTVFRVGQPVGDARSTTFALHGHTWRRAPKDPQSLLVANQGQFNPGVSYDVVLDPAVTGGAGGRRAVTGDYLYRSGMLSRHLVSGQWGLFRVYGTSQSGLLPLADHPVGAAAQRTARKGG
jgi:manganese oxidase